MSWFTDPNLEALYELDNMIEASAVDADFVSGNVRLTDWPAGLTLGADQYISPPITVDIEQSKESVKRVFEPKIYRVSGVDLSVLPESEIDASFGRSWTEYLVGIDAETHKMVGFQVAWRGYIGRIRRLLGDTPLIEIHASHELAAIDQADGYRRTHEHHQEFFPGDTGYRKTETLRKTRVAWGGFLVQPGGGVGSGGGGGAQGGRPRPSRL